MEVSQDPPTAATSCTTAALFRRLRAQICPSLPEPRGWPDARLPSGAAVTFGRPPPRSIKRDARSFISIRWASSSSGRLTDTFVSGCYWASD